MFGETGDERRFEIDLALACRDCGEFDPARLAGGMM